MFLLVIFGFGIWFFMKDTTESSALENRNLNHHPTFSFEGLVNAEYFTEFESYYNDQFPLREKFIENKSLFETKVFRKDIIDNIYLSNNGYLIEPFTKNASANKIADRINKFSDDLLDSGVNVFFALAPMKSIVFEEQLPEYYKGVASELSDEMMELLNKNTHPIDLRNSILPNKYEENMYFYSDHHWKPKAAHYAYVSIIEEMRKVYPGIPNPLTREDFDWEENPKEFYGSESRRVTKSNTKRSDTITIVKPKFDEEKIDVCSRGKCDRGFYNMNFLENEDLYTNRYITYFDGDVPEGIVKNPNVKNEMKILILKDSYANALIQFVARNFSETSVLDLRHNTDVDIRDYIKENKIEAVLFVHNINSLINTEEFTRFN